MLPFGQRVVFSGDVSIGSSPYCRLSTLPMFSGEPYFAPSASNPSDSPCCLASHPATVSSPGQPMSSPSSSSLVPPVPGTSRSRAIETPEKERSSAVRRGSIVGLFVAPPLSVPKQIQRGKPSARHSPLGGNANLFARFPVKKRMSIFAHATAAALSSDQSERIARHV